MVHPELIDPFCFLFSGCWEGQSRPRLRDFDARSPDQVEVVFNTVDGSAFMVARHTDVIDEPLMFQLITNLEPGSGNPGDAGSPRAAVEIDDDIVLFAPDPSDEAQEGKGALMGRDQDDLVDIRIPLDETRIWFFNDISEGGMRKGLLQRRDGRGRHDDVADAAETDE